MLIGLSSSASFIFSLPALTAVVGDEGDLKMASLVDGINAYSFQYPMEVPSQKLSSNGWNQEKPERYSSAAPLSLSIGPPNLSFLKSKDKSTWNAKDVANSVRSDKSALRNTSGQKLVENYSAIVSWQLVAQRTGAALKYVGLIEKEILDTEQLKSVLSNRTKLVVVHHVSNTLGSILPIDEIVSWSHSMGAKVLVDAAKVSTHGG